MEEKVEPQMHVSTQLLAGVLFVLLGIYVGAFGCMMIAIGSEKVNAIAEVSK